ncbi:MAG: hypothetical protein LPK25_05005 [Cyclobacteriaceae bacterium]|nr:hypothetical protein [Cyclobacteriaceae bacterium]MDX5466114.1 hypothetical protein [Cyclobacteriaceae bacterium]
MKKLGIAFLLGFCWLIGLSSQFSFSQAKNFSVQEHHQQTVIGESHDFQPYLRTASETVKTPPFEIDVRLLAKLNSEWIPDFIRVFQTHFSSSFFQKSKALFDVKSLFIQYFYSW